MYKISSKCQTRSTYNSVPNADEGVSNPHQMLFRSLHPNEKRQNLAEAYPILILH